MTIKKNIISNYFGNTWVTIMSLIFPPIYIKLLGIEAYGIIGFFSTLQILGIFDGGISTAMHRKISALSIAKKNTSKIGNIIRTTEIIYWTIALIICLMIFLSATYFSNQWLLSVKFSNQVIEKVLMISGLIIFFQWPSIIYKQSLMALNKQLEANLIHSIYISTRGIITVSALLFISKSIITLFVCFLLAELINTITLYMYVRSYVTFKNVSFRKEIFIEEWKFSSRLMIISALSLITSQIDKILLSKLISLENFGYYTLSTFIAFNIYKIFTPIVASINPTLIKLVKENDHEKLINFYLSQ